MENIVAVFKPDTTLRSHLVLPKDAVDPNKQDGVDYKITPYECGIKRSYWEKMLGTQGVHVPGTPPPAQVKSALHRGNQR